MSLILTSSRNPSVRVRQFIKEFSKLFPKHAVKIVNRGKTNLGDLFLKYKSANIIITVSNSEGNPNKLVVYKKGINNSFNWFLDIKIKFTRLHYELNIEENNNPKNTYISYKNINPDLKSRLNIFFENILDKIEIFDDKNVEDNDVVIQVKYNNPGFLINPLYVKNSIKEEISPEILIYEIIINDYEFEK